MEEKYFKGCLHEKIKDGFCANEGHALGLIYKGEAFDSNRILELYKWSGDWEEILPNVFYKHIKLEKKFWEFWKNEGFEWEIKIIDDPKVWIEVYYDEVPVGTKTPELKWASDKAMKVRAKEKKYKELWDIDDYKHVGEDFEYVPVSEIVGFPNLLGKGMSGCIQLANYSKRGLYADHDEWNGEMILAEVLEDSAKDTEKVKECIESNRCGWLYQRYLDGTLKDLGEYVKLNEVDGKYYIGGNGKHRICLLKRINAEIIYAKVYKWTKE